MRHLCALLMLAALAACAHTTPLQVAGVSHDSLALAQDIEAQLCWGVPDAYSEPTDKQHCTASTAVAIGLTDARHQTIEGKLAQAFALHRSLTALAKSGGTVDYTALNAVIADVLAIIGQLQQTPQVAQLTSAVKAGAK
jgi:hypothetical protein